MVLMKKDEINKFHKSMGIVNSFTHKPGTAVYASGLAVNKDYMKHGIGKKFIF
jgi:hypothetical protein